jgi:hypothetical protein
MIAKKGYGITELYQTFLKSPDGSHVLWLLQSYAELLQ